MSEVTPPPEAAQPGEQPEQSEYDNPLEGHSVVEREEDQYEHADELGDKEAGEEDQG